MGMYLKIPAYSGYVVKEEESIDPIVHFAFDKNSGYQRKHKNACR
jgi:hypothetical protein